MRVTRLIFELDIVPNGPVQAYANKAYKYESQVIKSRGVLRITEGPAHCQNQKLPRIVKAMQHFVDATGHGLSAMNPDLFYDVELVDHKFNPDTRKYEEVTVEPPFNMRSRINKVMGGYAKVASPAVSPYFVRLTVDASRLKTMPFYNGVSNFEKVLSRINESSKKGVELNPNLSQTWAWNHESSHAYAPHRTYPLFMHVTHGHGLKPGYIADRFPPIVGE